MIATLSIAVCKPVALKTVRFTLFGGFVMFS